MYPIWKWKENPELVGRLIVKINNFPPYGKKLYGFELDTGDIKYCFGTYVLVGLLAPLPFKTKVKLRCLGKGRESTSDKYDKILFQMEILQLATEIKKKKPKKELLPKL